MKACIKDFIKHTEDLEAEEDPDGNGYNREYRLIHEVQMKNRRDNVFKSDDGKLEVNLKKNRYKDILPYDDHRVHLKTINEVENSDYINASHIKGVKGSGGYIASQGPLAASVNDFWRMIWEYEVEIVFMACRLVELGKIKCKQYWHDLSLSDDFNDLNVLTEKEENISSDFTKRVFKVTRGEEVRMVTQYHYSGWPDHGVPSDPAHIRDLIALMRKERQKDKSPLLVHCSAGCGRTGAIIAIDYVWTLLEEGSFDEKFNLYNLICNFREQRMSMVQTADQYALVYKVLKSLCEDWIAKMATHTYVNVEIEDDYVNLDDVRESEAEAHIYEDSTLKESKPETKSALPPLPKKEDQGPEIIELPQASAKKVNEQPTGAVSSTPVTTANATPQTSVENEPKEFFHKTVIQIGAASVSKQPMPPSPGGKTTLAPSPPPSPSNDEREPHPESLVSSTSSASTTYANDSSNMALNTNNSACNSSPSLESNSKSEPLSDTDPSHTPAKADNGRQAVSNGDGEDAPSKGGERASVNGEKFQLPNDIITRL